MKEERCDGCSKRAKCRMFTYKGKYGIIVRFYCRDCARKEAARG